MGVPSKNPHFINEVQMTLNTSKTFSMEIERLAIDKNISHMDAVLDYCHRQDIEPDTVSRLISKSLKEKIEANARDLNFLPRQAQLPI
jgi:hypothetical protein|tara:strand:+ start:821 stop:1084 length:264 start_codon:yes stop_codon:yes gene_type:complete